jgi:hypothetical protein
MSTSILNLAGAGDDISFPVLLSKNKDAGIPNEVELFSARVGFILRQRKGTVSPLAYKTGMLGHKP